VSSDVAVVGAGIGGAVLALALGRRGWTVTLLERERQPHAVPRPEILWGATPDALDRLGIGETIRHQASVRVSDVEVQQRGRRLLSFSRRVLESAGVRPFSTDPAATRAAIADAALATGNVSIERGIEVDQIISEDQRIVGARGRRDGETVEFRARLIVGDDGANSVVRRAMGSSLELKIFPLDFITAAMNWPDELPPDRVSIWLHPEAFSGGGLPAIGCMPWPGGRGVALMPMPHQRAQPLLQSPLAAFWSEIARLTPLADVLQERLRFPEDFRHVRRPFGHAPQYVADGAAILGDAAHPVSPAGGQGANASIWDALALAEVAHEALAADDVSRQRLARYETLRRPRNAASLRFTQFATGALGYLPHVPGLPRLVPAAMRALDSAPWLKGRILSLAATTFVTR
jgi:6-methylpretetramide 4-monooxygenase